MRNRFAQTLTQISKTREDICLLSGDIGNRMFDSFKDANPTRFINCGIAEANMMSVACGMALTGMRPFVYTITPFITTRCLEQIKVGAAYHRAPVVIVGTGSGLSYSELGPTHHSLEDVALIKAIPDINICCPADKTELDAHLYASLESEFPTYIRIGKKGEPDLTYDQQFRGMGRSRILREGTDAIIISAGPITKEALDASDHLKENGHSVAVASISTIRPLDGESLCRWSSQFKLIVTVEEHWHYGGLGSEILEWLYENERTEVKLVRLDAGHKFINQLGKQSYSRRMLGIDSYGIQKKINQCLKNIGK